MQGKNRVKIKRGGGVHLLLDSEWPVAVNTEEAAETRYQDVLTDLQELGHWLDKCHTEKLSLTCIQFGNEKLSTFFCVVLNPPLNRSFEQ